MNKGEVVSGALSDAVQQQVRETGVEPVLNQMSGTGLEQLKEGYIGNGEYDETIDASAADTEYVQQVRVDTATGLVDAELDASHSYGKQLAGGEAEQETVVAEFFVPAATGEEMGVIDQYGRSAVYDAEQHTVSGDVPADLAADIYDTVTGSEQKSEQEQYEDMLEEGVYEAENGVEIRLDDAAVEGLKRLHRSGREENVVKAFESMAEQPERSYRDSGDAKKYTVPGTGNDHRIIAEEVESGTIHVPVAGDHTHLERLGANNY